MFKISIQKYYKNTKKEINNFWKNPHKKDFKNFEKLQKYILNVALKTFCITNILYTPGKNKY